MDTTTPTSADTSADLPQDSSPQHATTAWQVLPMRAALLAATTTVFWSGLLALGILAAWWHKELPNLHWAALTALVLLAVLAFTSHRRQRRTAWQFDGAALGLRRQLLWQADTRIPVSRVQHLDLRRGPLQRMTGLATLVVHTAGSRFNAVSIHGLDQADAERLRDRLARQIDLDDDAL